MSRKVYEIITQKIIEKLEKGVVAWKKPFATHSPVNWVTGREYRGINLLLLEPNGEYATFHQIKKAGGKVKKGERSSIVVFWKWIEIKNDDEDAEEETKKIPFLRYYRVFEINTQVEGLESKRKVAEYVHDPIEKAENIITNFKYKPKITHKNNGAWYNPLSDTVNVPDKSLFESVHEYYSVLFHEFVHATGHETRLNRKSVMGLNPFGSQEYSKEELIAEIGASMLCGVAGIENHTIDNSASYINGWLQALRNDHTLIVHASQQAQKACDYILGKTYEEGIEEFEDEGSVA